MEKERLMISYVENELRFQQQLFIKFIPNNVKYYMDWPKKNYN